MLYPKVAKLDGRGGERMRIAERVGCFENGFEVFD
jgi:hypothetical protein